MGSRKNREKRGVCRKIGVVWQQEGSVEKVEENKIYAGRSVGGGKKDKEKRGRNDRSERLYGCRGIKIKRYRNKRVRL